MRKQDLKVGEVYAVHLRASTARSKWRRDTPYRVKLVALTGKVGHEFNIRTRSDGGELIETKQMLYSDPGIIVELLDKPIARNVPVVGVEMSRSYGYGRSGHRLLPAVQPLRRYDSRHLLHKNEEPTGEEIKAEFKQLSLENAGCFVSTWAEHESALVAEKKAKDERVRQAQLRHHDEAINDPELRGRLKKLLDALTDKGFTVDPQTIDDDDPFVYYVGDDDGRFKIRPDYADHGKNGQKLIRVEASQISLSTMERLLDL